MSSTPITSNLREYVDWLYEHKQMVGIDHGVLLEIADRIESEHKRRMDDCRREVRREAIRYVRGVLTDLDRGVRRVRKGDKTEVVRCNECIFAHPRAGGTCQCDITQLVNRGDHYCAYGERREADE